ncbi:hypothetical protein ACFU99_01870 [Streptomyces sp. NPDC057654]|uniref:hypothetical protein n=1 Tax=Streptomyces sp. NPDC057654 TaxID=3346196 RepID=UPI0036AE0FCA
MSASGTEKAGSGAGSGNDGPGRSGPVKGDTVDSKISGGRAHNVVQGGTISSLTFTEAPPRRAFPPVIISVAFLVVMGVVGGVLFAVLNHQTPLAEHQVLKYGPVPGAESRPGSADVKVSPSPSAPAAGPPAASGEAAAPGEGAARPGGQDEDMSSREGAARKSQPSPAEPSAKPNSSSATTWKIVAQEETILGQEVIDGDPCGHYSLCAYRRARHQGRYDFPAPDSGPPGKTCYSFPSGDPGFVSVFNGRGYSYRVYERPKCEGGMETITPMTTNYQDLKVISRFRSYVKA